MTVEFVKLPLKPPPHMLTVSFGCRDSASAILAKFGEAPEIGCELTGLLAGGTYVVKVIPCKSSISDPIGLPGYASIVKRKR